MNERYLKRIFNENHKKLVWTATSLIGDFYAEDLVSEIFVSIWKDGIPDKFIGKESGYLYFKVKEKCGQALKDQRDLRKDSIKVRHGVSMYKYQKCGDLRPQIKHHLSQQDISDEYADSLAIRSELLSMLTQKVNQMPPARKEVFTKIFIEGMKSKDVPGNVQSATNLTKKIIEDLKIYGMKIINTKKHWHMTGGGTFKLVK